MAYYSTIGPAPLMEPAEKVLCVAFSATLATRQWPSLVIQCGRGGTDRLQVSGSARMLTHNSVTGRAEVQLKNVMCDD